MRPDPQKLNGFHLEREDLFNLMPLRELYEAVDWPVIVLLGALIPVGGALETTGATDVLARYWGSPPAAPRCWCWDCYWSSP